jgi:hypothetical protein
VRVSFSDQKSLLVSGSHEICFGPASSLALLARTPPLVRAAACRLPAGIHLLLLVFDLMTECGSVPDLANRIRGRLWAADT